MERKLIAKPRRVVERNIELTAAVMEELLAKPDLLEQLPPGFRLVVLPEGETDVWLYNLDLLRKNSSPEAPVVIARIAASSQGANNQTSFYAPLTA